MLTADCCLASRCESSAMCEGETEIFVGVNRCVVDANFVMQVGSCTAAAQTDISNRIAAVNVLANGDRKICQMSVAGSDPVAVVQHNRPSIAAQEFCEQNHAVSRRDYRLPIGSRDIDTAVECTLTIERIRAFAK